MKSAVSKIFLIGLIIFLLMQFWQPARNLSGQVLPTHIEKVYDIPPGVQELLANSCYDCHSNNTRYPWYSYIQPGRMFMDSHITEGKDELNLSEFGNYSKRRQESKLESMAKQITSGEMPLESYTLIHRDAKLSAASKKILIAWIEKISDSLSQDY